MFFFLKEISTIKPKHIIFYTSSKYKWYVDEGIRKNELNKTNEIKYKIYLNNKQYFYCYTYNINIDKNICHCLYFLHPERKKEDNFTKAVAEFIKDDTIEKIKWISEIDKIGIKIEKCK